MITSSLLPAPLNAVVMEQALAAELQSIEPAGVGAAKRWAAAAEAAQRSSSEVDAAAPASRRLQRFLGNLVSRLIHPSRWAQANPSRAARLGPHVRLGALDPLRGLLPLDRLEGVDALDRLGRIG